MGLNLHRFFPTDDATDRELMDLIQEMEVMKMLVYIEFLASTFGKGVYICFVGLFLFSDENTVDMVFSIGIMVIGLFGMAVACISRKGK